MWLPLFANFAVTAMVLIAWSAIGDRLSRWPTAWQQTSLGVVMGAGVLGSMTMAYQVAPGVFYDLRGPIITVAALFGGVPATIVVAGVATLFRIYLGGAIGPGVLSIAMAAVLGLSAYALHRGKRVEFSSIFLLSSMVALITVLVSLTLPSELRAAVMPSLHVSVTIGFFATAFLGTVLLHEARRRDLAIENRFYRAMVEALPDSLNIKDTEGRFLVANRATAKLMGATKSSDLIGKTDFDFYSQELATEFRADELAMLGSVDPVTIEQHGQLPDGSYGWLSTLKAPVVDQDGIVVALVTLNRDITAQRSLQNKLAETQGYLDQALDNMNDGLAMFDPEGIVLFCNDRYRELFPRTAHLRVAGSSFIDIIRGSLEEGEELLQPSVTIAQHIRAKQAQLHENGERSVDLGDGRTFLMRTKVLPNGCSLRMMADITGRRIYEKKLEHLALHDTLTGLPNRACFNEELAQRISGLAAGDNELVVMLLDLDRFKNVNDSFGHSVGDKLLIEIGRRLGQAIRPSDMVARLGGDEFAILMTGPSLAIGAVHLANRVMKTLAQPLSLEGIALLPGATIGYTICPPDQSDAEGLLKNADKALYQAKAKGRGTWKAYDAATSADPLSEASVA